MYFTEFESPFCPVILVGESSGVKYLHLETGMGKRKFEIAQEWIRNDSVFANPKKQIEEYFAGTRTEFDVQLNLEGTEFQKKVWCELQKIPYGTVSTYKDIADKTGNIKACRAVGMANSLNPVPLIIPCHRVVGTNGKLVGFAHGLTLKESLLHFEKGKCR